MASAEPVTDRLSRFFHVLRRSTLPVVFLLAAALFVPAQVSPETLNTKADPLAAPGTASPTSPNAALSTAPTDDKNAGKSSRPSDHEEPVAMTMALFLDRLMMAESGGRDNARSTTSTALGAFQFIDATFLEIARVHFAEETEDLSPREILVLRTDRGFARRAAEAYTRDNAAYLADHGIKPTFPHLRLAYLVGPSAAVRTIQASPDTPVSAILSPAAMRANAFMRGLAAKDLIRRAARDIAASASTQAGVEPGKRRHVKEARKPQIKVNCNLSRPSCQRWRALAVRRLQVRPQRPAATRRAQN